MDSLAGTLLQIFSPPLMSSSVIHHGTPVVEDDDILQRLEVAVVAVCLHDLRGRPSVHVGECRHLATGRRMLPPGTASPGRCACGRSRSGTCHDEPCRSHLAIRSVARHQLEGELSDSLGARAGLEAYRRRCVDSFDYVETSVHPHQGVPIEKRTGRRFSERKGTVRPQG